MHRRLIALALITAAALGAVVTFFVVEALPGGGGGSSPQSAPTSAVAASTPSSGGGNSGLAASSTSCLSAADIFDRVHPAVVEVVRRSSSAAPFGPPSQGEGSGIIIDEQGTILTNNHVVENADTLEVRFADQSVVSARVIGTDPGNDLAVIHADVSGQKLTVAPLGASSSLRVGDAVLAIGNPFQLEQTLTQGIVSALGRTFSPAANAKPIRNMIQTDAPVNPGNSGGPLIDCHGEVVGINTLIENPTGDNVNVGIAFAVAIDTAKASLPQMLSGTTVSHPWLGIAGQELTPALAKELSLSTERGVYVTLVEPGSPADQAGLHGAFSSQSEAAQAQAPAPGGDVIVSADGQPVASIDDLAGYLERTKKPGDGVKLGVQRGDKTLTVEATLANWPS